MTPYYHFFFNKDLVPLTVVPFEYHQFTISQHMDEYTYAYMVINHIGRVQETT